MGIFDRNKGVSNETPEQPDLVEPKKTTPDEGKTFDKDMVFVCVQDCYQDGTRYRRGDTVKGTKCPPWFTLQEVKAEDKKK